MQVSSSCFEGAKNGFVTRGIFRNGMIQTASAAAAGRKYSSVFDLAKDYSLENPNRKSAFKRIFEVYSANATCTVGKKLANKYNMDEENSQFVVSIRNRITFEQTWFNNQRANKPQNFKTSAATERQDPTQNGLNCDFCDWQNLTAIDDFGRIEYASVVSGSNLFKYCAPCHGVLVFKKHHPLDFDFMCIKELMLCTHDWLEKATKLHGNAKYPLFVWNCLARAGASQFHGHAQVMISPVPFPCYESMKSAMKSFSVQYPGRSYLKDLMLAYKKIGLLRVFQIGRERSHMYPSLTPWKDMEIVIWTDSLKNQSFHYALFHALQTLITKFGVVSFNVGIQGMELNKPGTEDKPHDKRSTSEIGPLMARIVSRGKATSSASDFGGLEVFGGSSIGHTDPFAINELFSQHISTPKAARQPKQKLGLKMFLTPS